MKHATPTACAAALFVTSVPSALLAAPPTCADILKKIEKQMVDAGTAQPQLKVVPKGLASGAQVVASCENGTQRIVRRPPAAASAAAPASTGPAPDKTGAARKR